MSEAEKRCERCERVLAPESSEPLCPMCMELWLQGASMEENREGKYRPPRKFSPEDAYSPFAGLDKSRGIRWLRPVSPFFLFAVDVLTLGASSVFWIEGRLPLLLLMARPEERGGGGAIRAFNLSYGLFLFCALWSVWAGYLAGFDPVFLQTSRLIRFALLFGGVFWLSRCHMLLWARGVIMDGLESSERDSVRCRASSFAPSAFAIWFLGVPYLQFHINRLIRKGTPGGRRRRAAPEKTEPAEAAKDTSTSADDSP